MNDGWWVMDDSCMNDLQWMMGDSQWMMDYGWKSRREDAMDRNQIQQMMIHQREREVINDEGKRCRQRGRWGVDDSSVEKDNMVFYMEFDWAFDQKFWTMMELGYSTKMETVNYLI